MFSTASGFREAPGPCGKLFIFNSHFSTVQLVENFNFSTVNFQQAAALVPWSAHALGGDLLGREAARRRGQLGRVDAADGLPSRSALPAWHKL